MVLSVTKNSLKANHNYGSDRNFNHNNGYVYQKELVRSIVSNQMPTSPSEVKLSHISTPPPQTASSFTSNGMIPKNSNSNGNSSPPNHTTSKTSLSPSPPGPHVISRSHSLSNSADSVALNSAVRQSKLKRFLTTLYQFANDISPEVGERVRLLIFGLVSSKIDTEEFHQKIQEITNYPLRPYVIPFLKLHLPVLHTDITQLARSAKTNPAQYLKEHESLILDSSNQSNSLSIGEPFEIFQRNDNKDNQNKRRLSPEISAKENGFTDSMDRESGPPPAKRHQPMLSPTIGSRSSPAGLAPLLLHHSSAHHSHPIPNPSILHSHLSSAGRAMFEESNTTSSLYHSNNSRDNTTNGRNHSSHSSSEHLNDRYSSVTERFEREYCRPGVGLYSHLQRDYTDDRDMEEEWKNINTMLNCILGMVEKTKRALAILQHRSESRVNEYNNSALWNLPTLRSRHFNPMEAPHSSHSSHDFHDLKKIRIDSLLSNHFQKTALNDIPVERIGDMRRIAGSHKQLDDAVNEVKRQAVVELQKAVSAAETKASELVAAERLKMEKLVTDARRQAAEEALAAITHQEDSTENCWNCGRKASETCSGCNVARYCGSFCQHKDWENHHRVCQNTSNNGSVGQTTICGDKSSKSRSPTPASNAANPSAGIGIKSSTSAVTVSAGDLRDASKVKSE